MRRLKTIIPIAGILLLILSAASLYAAMRDRSKVRPAEDYEDQGVRSFAPYAVYPVQVQNTGASGRGRRMNPTETLYMVYYLAADGSGYKWSSEALTRDSGEEIVEAGETVSRRVLSIPSDGTYITVGPEQTAGSYVESLRGRYARIVGLSALYILFYFIVLLLVKLVRRLRKNRAEDKEPERASAPRDASNASRFDPEIKESGRFHHAGNQSGWRQEPGGIEARKPPRIPFRMKLSLLILAAAFLLFVFQRLGSSDPVAPDDSGNSLVPVNQYLPPAGVDGYFTATFPLSLLGNMTPEELLEDFREDAETAAEQGLTPDQFPRFRDLIVNGDGSVTYSFTEEQYRKSKEDYDFWGLRILPEMFGLDPAEIVKGLEYAQVDENGIPWAVNVRVDRAAFQNQGNFAEFIAQLVPYTMVGRYQIMCGVPAGEWSVHVTVRDAGSGEVILEQDFYG